MSVFTQFRVRIGIHSTQIVSKYTCSECTWLYGSRYPLKCIVPLFPIGTWNLHSSLPQITADQFWITDLLGSRSDSGCSTRWSSVNLSHLSPPSCCRALSLGLCCSWFTLMTYPTVISTVQMLADDCMVYREILDIHDTRTLHAALDSFQRWERDRLMEFNPSECEQCFKMLVRPFTKKN